MLERLIFWKLIVNQEESFMRKALYPVAILAFSVTTSLFASEAPHWGYEGEAGPARWGELSPEFGACGTGKNQSPINLEGFTEGDLSRFEKTYRAGPAVIENNGHTVQINTQPGSYLTLDNKRFELKQFHFHSPSENQIEGKSFPLEAHLVHQDAQGNLAVVAVMFEAGKGNPFLAEIWSDIPKQAGESIKLANSVNVQDLLPSSSDYYRFNGSLTTPPCTEGVRWLVMKQPVEISKQQLKQFTSAIHSPNNRPVQPVNARMVIK